MSYATVMIALELGKSNAGLLKVAADVAERFGAGIVGVAACESISLTYGGEYVTGEAFEQIQEQTGNMIRDAEAEFRATLSPRMDQLEWRSAQTYESLCDYFARQARSADLIVAAAGDGSMLHSASRLSTSDLVMRAGRPVLLVPPGSTEARLDRVLVGWKETREARRAVLDALPLLQSARHVVLAEIAPADRLVEAREHLADVARWLSRHGVTPELDASIAKGSAVDSLAKTAHDHGADIIVAGAYGHSRLREWALGGVTCDLLLNTHRFALLSH